MSKGGEHPTIENLACVNKTARVTFSDTSEPAPIGKQSKFKGKKSKFKWGKSMPNEIAPSHITFSDTSEPAPMENFNTQMALAHATFSAASEPAPVESFGTLKVTGYFSTSWSPTPTPISANLQEIISSPKIWSQCSLWITNLTLAVTTT